MNVNCAPANSLRELEQALAELSGMPRRVQVQHVLPLVEKLHGYGFTFAEIAKRMGEVGLSFQPNSLKLAVHRWRKKQSAQSVSRPDSPPKVVNDIVFGEGGRSKCSGEDAGPLGFGVSAPAPLTKAILQGIRDEHIDLEGIKRQARRQRATE
jgi:hypothetical protein